MGTPVVGVTGSIGTGKSTFAESLTQNEGRYIDADQLAKSLMAPDREAYDAVVEEFGQEILDEDGGIDSGALAKRVFQDSEELETLEDIIHPLVIDSISEQIRDSGSEFYVIEAPLLFEAGVDELCDWVITVTASPDRVRERLQDREMSSKEIDRRRSRQLSQDEKAQRADEVVENNGTIEELRRKAQNILGLIRERSFEDGR